MKVLVTGVKGQLGYDVCKRLDALHIENKGVDLSDFDITDMDQTRAAICAYRPDCVVHCAAYTAVDRAETDEKTCFLVNETGTENIARVCKEINAKMVYISTDYVFEGIGDLPYEVDDVPNPQNAYGKSKLAGELAAKKWTDKLFIVRISWAFGLNGNNFVKTMLRLGNEKESLPVVCDQFGSPTYTADLAVLLCDMIQTNKYGTYHATNEGVCSWAEFAQEIMHVADLPCKIIPVTSEEYGSKTKRPMNSRLSKKSLDLNGFQRLTRWRKALREYLSIG